LVGQRKTSVAEQTRSGELLDRAEMANRCYISVLEARKARMERRKPFAESKRKANMASLATPKTLRRLAGGVVLSAAVAALQAVCSEPVPVSTPRNAEQLVAEIQAEESRNGPNSAQLIELLSALGRVYREADDPLSATAAIQRALAIVRVNYGFASLDQATLLRELLENDEARGDIASAKNREKALLALAAKNPRDLRTVPIYREIADRRMNLLRRFTAGEYTPEIVLPFTREYEEAVILHQAWNGYWGAISVLRENQLYRSDELRDLEMQIVRSAYQRSRQRGRQDRHQPYDYYEVGRRGYERLLADATASSRPWASRAALIVEMADWDILFGHYSSAFDSYERAYALLEEQSPGGASMEPLLSPRIPVVLPTFLPNPLAPNETAGTAGHVDVALEIDRYGYSRRIEVVDASANASDDAKRNLVRTIERSRFRPRMVDSKLAPKSRVVVRYFVSDEGPLLP
jgi:hypothetical protein